MELGDISDILVWAAATSETLRVLEGKWKIVIIVQLFAAKVPLRFSELEKRIEGVNQKMLIQQLKELEKDGIVSRPDHVGRREVLMDTDGHPI